jgi:hypothetical protein
VTPRDLAEPSEPGRPLPEEHRARLEPIVGTNLRDVRIHTGELASELANRLRAEAFAIGRDVYFGRGRFDPTTPRGRALLAHELVHVRQQTSGGRRLQRYGGDGDSAEAEAVTIERAVLAQAQGQSTGQLAVEAYVRNYAATDGIPVTPTDRARLDGISIRALAICEQSLGPALFQFAARVIDDVDVAVTLDLSVHTDEQAAEVWGRAMADAIRQRLP